MAAPFDAPLAAWHTCNFYCRGDEHCDISYRWSSATDLPFEEAMARRSYERYGARLVRFEPAHEIQPTEIPEGHVLADFRGASLIWFDYPAS